MNKFFVIIFLFFYFLEAQAEEKLLHVSFDTTRELFKDINNAFIGTHKVKIRQSHGGSGKQTASIIHGLPAEVVSLALPYHMDLLAGKNIVPKNWRELFPNNSSPFGTRIAFLVRQNNPKNIQDWSDLVRQDIQVISANPKTSGGALWGYLAAWLYAKKHFTNNPQEYLKRLYSNIPVLDSSARNASITFIKRRIGDVLITWENEARFIIAKVKPDFEIIIPSITVQINIPVSYTINQHHQGLAKEYINFLFSAKGQEIIKKHYYLSLKEIKPEKQTIEDWPKFKKDHFEQGGIFDKIYDSIQRR